MTVHAGDKLFTCEVCGKAFIPNSILKNHMKSCSVHCKVCGEALLSNDHLKSHMTSPTAENPVL